MKNSRLRTRSAGAMAAAVALVSLATASGAGAAPVRTAATAKYGNATYLQHALGLPASDTDPAIEPVTYDRFQWLLQQPGNFAVLIGDPALDASFDDRARDVEAKAKSAGVKKIYWFDPNLSGSAKVGDITEPALDIRNAAGISSLVAGSQAKYDDAWSNLVGLYLGNGITITSNQLNSESATVTVAKGVSSAINDAGGAAGHSTNVQDHAGGGALYDYTSDSAPANALHSFFFIYNKDHTDGAQAAKIVAWTDLTTTTTTAKDVDDALAAAGGAANLAEADQFAWWKSEVDTKQVTQAGNAAQGAGHPVLTDADKAEGWRINQVTYPELVDLLKSATTANAVILFGGTWCPNTRPVLPFVNKYAQQNDVEVYNFDTVLDGGLVGGATTSASNPLQTRNYTGTNSTGTTRNNPSFLYGDLVNQYLNNLKTEYDNVRKSTDPFVSYYANGGADATVTKIRKLQVPYLVGYQGSGGAAPNGGVTRQWIIDRGDGSYTEYMSQWWYTNPQPNELGITTIPATAPIWSTINSQLAGFTWQSDPTSLYANTAADGDDANYLVDADTATVTYTAASGGTPAKVTVAASGSTTISPAALSAALAALGGAAPANLAAAKSALIDAETATPQDPALIGNLTTVVGAWGVAQLRKTKVNAVWGNATSPGSVAGGLAAVHALDVFFAGLPDPAPAPGNDTPAPAPAAGSGSTAPAATTPITVKPAVVRTKAGKVKVTLAKRPTSRRGGRYKVTITVPKGAAAPSGKVTLKLKKGKLTKTVTGRLSKGVATFTLPKLARGTWKVTISWPGDARYLKVSVTAPSIKVIK